MNIYVVTSGPIEYVEHVPGMFGGPMMEYSIGEIVAAETRGGAKWVAWRADKTSGAMSIRYIGHLEGWKLPEKDALDV